MPCQNCGLDEGGFDALDGNNVCPGCGLVLEHTPLSANIEFTKVGSRFHVVGAFIKSTEDRLPIRVLNNNKVGQGSKEMYKWNRMRQMMQEVKSMVEQIGSHYKEVEDRLRIILRNMFGDRNASLGIRARRIYAASILLVLQEKHKGITIEDCSKTWSIPLDELKKAKNDVDTRMKNNFVSDFPAEDRIIQVRASLRTAILKLERVMYPALTGQVEEHIEEPIIEAVIDRAMEVYETLPNHSEMVPSAQTLGALLHFSFCFSTAEITEDVQHKQLCRVATVSRLSELLNVGEEEIEHEIEHLLGDPQTP